VGFTGALSSFNKMGGDDKIGLGPGS